MFLLPDLLESPCFDILICGKLEQHINTKFTNRRTHNISDTTVRIFYCIPCFRITLSIIVVKPLKILFVFFKYFLIFWVVLFILLL